VLGTVFLGAVVALSSTHVSALVGGLGFAVFFGLLSWLLARGRRWRVWATAHRAGRGRPRDPRPAFRRGLVFSLLLTLAEIAVLVVFAWLWGLKDVGFVAGIVLGCAVLQGLVARDLRRWQEENQLVVCRKVGARRVAWTGAQAEGRLVVVRAECEPGGTPAPDDENLKG
jgi:uncharacterized membrane protein YjgN (DUF898 family)